MQSISLLSFAFKVIASNTLNAKKKETKCIDTCISLNGELRLSQWFIYHLREWYVIYHNKGFQYFSSVPVISLFTFS
jgi:hypothetical protein